LMGLLTGGAAIIHVLDAANPRRINNVLFWGIYSLTFFAGSHFSDFTNGCLVIVMVASATIRGLGGRRPNDSAVAPRKSNVIFVPALLIPAVTLVGVLFLGAVHVGDSVLVDPKQVTQVSLGIATLVSLAAAIALFRPPLLAPIRESTRLFDAVG